MLSKKLCKFLIQSKSYTNYWIIIIRLEYKYQKTLYDFFQYFFNYFSFFIFFLTFFIENFINFYIMHSLLFSSIALNHKLSFRINIHVHLSFEYIVKDITTYFVQRQLSNLKRKINYLIFSTGFTLVSIEFFFLVSKECFILFSIFFFFILYFYVHLKYHHVFIITRSFLSDCIMQ